MLGSARLALHRGGAKGKRLVSSGRREDRRTHRGPPTERGGRPELGEAAPIPRPDRKGNTARGGRPDGRARELPGEVIEVGGAIVVPPYGTRQRQFDKVPRQVPAEPGRRLRHPRHHVPRPARRSVTTGACAGRADIQKVFARRTSATRLITEGPGKLHSRRKNRAFGRSAPP